MPLATLFYSTDATQGDNGESPTANSILTAKRLINFFSYNLHTARSICMLKTLLVFFLLLLMLTVRPHLQQASIFTELDVLTLP